MRCSYGRVLPALVICLAGCQSYDFEPVVPTTLVQSTQAVGISFRTLRPNVLMVVDRSGSMSAEVDCPLATCPSRLQAVKNAMGGFLSTQGAIARFGMLPYGVGSGTSCAAPDADDVAATGVEVSTSEDVPSELQAHANLVNAQIQDLEPGGRTPTGPTLRNMLAYTPILDPERSDFILLLTDGFPNCNPENVYTCSNMSTCNCTFPDAQGGCTTGAGTCSIGCLDGLGTSEVVADLRTAGVRTIVIGFGADLNGGDGFTVLNQISDQGGFGRPCESNSDCSGGDSCTDGFCEDVRFYTAQDSAELAVALGAISSSIGADPCFVVLATPPSDPDLLAVSVNGENVPSGDETWRLLPGGKVEFVGDLCDQLRGQGDAELSFKVIERL